MIITLITFLPLMPVAFLYLYHAHKITLIQKSLLPPVGLSSANHNHKRATDQNVGIFTNFSNQTERIFHDS